MKELKEFDYFKAWLIFFLVATVGGAILGIIAGSFVAAFMGAGGIVEIGSCLKGVLPKSRL